MIHLAVFLFCCAGFGALALAMERTQQDRLGRALSRAATRWLRGAGWGLLLLALWLAQRGLGWNLGLVAYSGHTSAAAGLIFIGLLVWNRSGTGARPVRARSGPARAATTAERAGAD